MRAKIINSLVIGGLVYGVFLLAIKYFFLSSRIVQQGVNILALILLIAFTGELIYRYKFTVPKKLFWRGNFFSLTIWLVILILVGLSRTQRGGFTSYNRLYNLILGLLSVRYFYHSVLIISSIPKLSLYLEQVLKRPAQTVALSFFIVIIIGAILLWMPFAANDGISIGFLNALFTATSAVCVTGLIVVDTATRFSPFGHLVILILIQIGGLGIMILSYFAAFIIGKRVSLEEKIALSFVLNEREIRRLSGTILRIVVLTFTVELLGAMLLYRFFETISVSQPRAVFWAIFHAVSAFCNAGFALFPNSLMDFRSNVYLNLTVCTLIILGGLSFSVLSNLLEKVAAWFRSTFLGIKSFSRKLTLNTKAVLIVTLLFLTSSTLVIYALEHRFALIGLDLPTQYLAAFFQAVTARTAGFNTIDIGSLRVATLLLLCVLMFIGAASGSTGGGVKVNTVFVVFAYIRTLIGGKNEVITMRHTLAPELIARSLLIIILALLVVVSGIIGLMISENFALHQIIFEVVSAFGTVGLSTGITPFLSGIGKLLIICIMFIGRIGPMTLILAISRPPILGHVRYPAGEINIG